MDFETACLCVTLIKKGEHLDPNDVKQAADALMRKAAELREHEKQVVLGVHNTDARGNTPWAV